MWTRSVPVGEIRRLGDHSLLIGLHDARSAQALTRALAQSSHRGICEVVGGLATVMVSVDPDGVDPDELQPWLAELLGALDPASEGAGGQGKLVTVPCVFDGPDMADVAEWAGCPPERVIELVTASLLTVAVVGFSPGFAYLEGLPDALSRIPRRRRPRPVVRAGSVALANGHAAVYPSASPGGWQLIGRTAEPFFDAGVPPYARLAPGDRVRFTAHEALASPPPSPTPARSSDPPGDPVFVVEQPGMRTLRQDGGRRGLAAIGVPAAGPADPDAFELANRLVGNPPDAGALEVTAKGPALRCVRPTFVAVVGARPELYLDGQPVAVGQVVPVGVGQRLSVGLVRGGLRCYLAVAGGFVGPALLGSCATDLLSGLGPGPLVTGDQLATGVMRPPLGDHLSPDTLATGSSGEATRLRVLPGPHHESFAPGAFAALASRRFTVGADSNRIGLRLQAPDGSLFPAPASGGMPELDSQGTVTGAVQVPPDGQPVILLPDHATMGGYPVLAVVASADHGLLGQCAPGTTLVLQPMTQTEARRAWAVHRRGMGSAVVGHYPLALE